MTEKNIDITQNNNVPEHPEPKADTNTPYEDDDEEENYEEPNTEKKVIVDLENYFEIVMMTSPVAGIKYYMPRYQPTQQHVLIIQNPKTMGG